MMSQNKIKVLFVHFGDEWIRGSEIVLLDLLQALNKDQFEPIVWCNGSELAKRLSTFVSHVILTKLEYYFDYESPRFNLLYYITMVLKARQIIKKYNVALIHCNGIAPTQWMFAAGLQHQIPILLHIHSFYLFRSRMVAFAHGVNRLVGVSEYTLAPFRSDGFEQDRMTIIKNGINIARIKLGESLKSENNKEAITPLKIGAVGSLICRKGIDILIRAFAKCLTKVTVPIYLVIAGDGPEREALICLARSLHILDNVRFEGVVNDMSSFLSNVDILAHFPRDEAFGLVLIEAGIHSKPVCATNVGGIPEIIIHKFNGLLVSPDDVDSAAAALLSLIADQSLRQSLGENGRKIAESHFLSASMARSFENCYMELLNNTRYRKSNSAGLASIWNVGIRRVLSRLRYK